MRFNKLLLMFFFFFIFSITVNANANAKGADRRDVVVNFIRDGVKGYVELKYKNGNKYLCETSELGGIYNFAPGEASLTNDGKAILIYSWNVYIKTDELADCGGKLLRLHKTPVVNNDIYSVVDINFHKKIILALVVIDAQTSSYQALVSYFNSDENIFSGKGFWNDNVDDVDVENDTFYVDLDDFYLGRISLSGRFFSPSTLDCSADSFPGVWDIKNRRKVVFMDNDESVVEWKCKEIFDGRKTLEELNGVLSKG
ncbi:hypothetical protein KH388_01555 [Serratia rubidaea]|nr:hypothetical protein [Serratia rubidaea]